MQDEINEKTVALDAAFFQEADLQMYGTEKEIRFLSRTYLWGQELYQPLKFVLVEYEKT